MENQKSNAKMYVTFFAISIILFATAAMIGLSINVSKDHLNAVTSAGEAIHRSYVNTEEMVYQEYAQLTGMQDTAFNPDMKHLRNLSSDLISYIKDANPRLAVGAACAASRMRSIFSGSTGRSESLRQE